MKNTTQTCLASIRRTAAIYEYGNYPSATHSQAVALAILFNKILGNDDKARHGAASVILNHPITSFKDITKAEASALLQTAYPLPNVPFNEQVIDSDFSAMVRAAAQEVQDVA